ncbi:MAG: zinc ribbon domain-containing protein, partial [Methylomonas sp.]
MVNFSEENGVSKSNCQSCGEKLIGQFKFCPHCGGELQKKVSCPECQCINYSSANFCHECGCQLSKNKSDLECETSKVEFDDLPKKGVTIEFPFSNSQTFDFALEYAQSFSSFKKYGKGKNAIYRVTFELADMESSLELVEHLKGWRRRSVYIDAQKMDWNSVF